VERGVAGPSEPVLRRALEALGRDRTRGAYGIAARALDLLQRAERARAPDPPKLLRKEIVRIADALPRLQPAMGVMYNLADSLRRISRRSNRDLGAAVRAFRVDEARRLERELSGVVRTGEPALGGPGAWVTLSSSEAVRRTLVARAASQDADRVYVLESLPGAEGVPFARALRSRGIGARVVADDRGADRLRGSRGLLVGADAILRDGSLVHKVGTRGLADAASAAGVPVYVLSGTSKMIERTVRTIAPVPPLFDVTPPSRIALYLTEIGAVPPGAVRSIVRLARRRSSQGP